MNFDTLRIDCVCIQAPMIHMQGGHSSNTLIYLYSPSFRIYKIILVRDKLLKAKTISFLDNLSISKEKRHRWLVKNRLFLRISDTDDHQKLKKTESTKTFHSRECWVRWMGLGLSAISYWENIKFKLVCWILTPSRRRLDSLQVKCVMPPNTLNQVWPRARGAGGRGILGIYAAACDVEQDLPTSPTWSRSSARIGCPWNTQHELPIMIVQYLCSKLEWNGESASSQTPKSSIWLKTNIQGTHQWSSALCWNQGEWTTSGRHQQECQTVNEEGTNESRV